MTIGMLWFDNSNKPLREKIELAADYYLQKYGKNPNVCFVSKSETDLDGPAGIRVKATRQVLKGHLWIGVEES